MTFRSFLVPGLVIASLALAACKEDEDETAAKSTSTVVTPNWAAISAWPSLEAPQVQAIPDPNRQITVIVLDDSGSMGGDIDPAKAAVISALDAMKRTDRIAVVALNKGEILPFTDVGDARDALRAALMLVYSDGGTPLTGAVNRARELLEQEAATARSFGTYRIIVTTDGAADDDEALVATIEDLARTTPVQLATIGIGLGGRHVLKRSDLGVYVDVTDVEALAEALQKAVAESKDFDAVTDFEETK